MNLINTMLNDRELFFLKKAKGLIMKYLNEEISGKFFEKKYLEFRSTEILRFQNEISIHVLTVLEEEFYHIDGYCSFKELQDGENTFDNYGDEKLKRLSKKTLGRIQQFLDGVDPEKIDLTPFYD